MNFFNRWETSGFIYKAFDSILMENKVNVIEKPINIDTLTPRLTEKAIKFIEKSSQEPEPFLLFYSFPNPHTPLVHRGWSSHGAYGDSVMEMDKSIGRVLDSLDKLGLAEDTLVYFTSDHGADQGLGLAGGTNEPFRGGKGNSGLEGGIRVPGVLRWPNKIPAGSKTKTFTSHLDLYPTLLEIANAKSKTQLDGKSILSLLKNPKETKFDDRFFRHYCGTILLSVTLATKSNGAFKAHFRQNKIESQNRCMNHGICICTVDPHLEDLGEEPIIYDLDKDPSEMEPIDVNSKQ